MFHLFWVSTLLFPLSRMNYKTDNYACRRQQTIMKCNAAEGWENILPFEFIAPPPKFPKVYYLLKALPSQMRTWLNWQFLLKKIKPHNFMPCSKVVWWSSCYFQVQFHEAAEGTGSFNPGRDIDESQILIKSLENDLQSYPLAGDASQGSNCWECSVPSHPSFRWMGW